MEQVLRFELKLLIWKTNVLIPLNTIPAYGAECRERSGVSNLEGLGTATIPIPLNFIFRTRLY